MKLSGIQKEVLHALVDRYERRQDYGSSEKSRRRTLLKIDNKSHPDYFHVSNSSFRLMFNAEMESLQHMGFVVLEWVRFDRRHTLERVALVEEKLPGIYASLGRQSKKQVYAETAELLEALKGAAQPALHPFYEQLLQRLDRYEPLPSPLRAGKDDEVKDLLKGLNALFEAREEEIVKRVLSVQLYGDSKRWQQLEKGILQLLRDFSSSGMYGDSGYGVEDDASDADLLAQRGVVDNPRHIHLSGPLVLLAPGGQIDLSLFDPDLGLPTKMVDSLTVLTCAAQAVVTVENLTAFYQYVQWGPPHQLVVYLGGFANRARILFLQKLYRYFGGQNREAVFYHWGDPDLGGFQIWHNLRQKTGIPFQPLFMDEATYLSHLHLGHPITEQYAARLAALLDDDSFIPFHVLISLILQKRIRLEQEAIAISLNLKT